MAAVMRSRSSSLLSFRCVTSLEPLTSAFDGAFGAIAPVRPSVPNRPVSVLAAEGVELLNSCLLWSAFRAEETRPRNPRLRELEMQRNHSLAILRQLLPLRLPGFRL